MYNATIKSNHSLLTISLALLFFLFSGVHLDAQITINENIFTDLIGKKYKEVLYETSLNIDGELAEIKAAIGPDQIWNFGGYNYIDSTVTIYELMVIDPDDPFLEIPELASSQYVNRITILPGSGGVEDTLMTYIYTSFEDSKWTVNGSFTLIDIDLDGSPDSTLQFFVPPSLQVPFPVTSTSMWYDSTNLITVFDGMEFVGSIMIDSNWVEGYGTLITPYGTAEALRVHNKSLNKNPFLPIVAESNNYDFVTEDDMMSASIVVEDGRAFYSVRTNLEGPSSTYDLDEIKFTINNVSPNPFVDYLDVNVNILKGDEVDCRLVTSDGQSISLLREQYLHAGRQNIHLPTIDIASGLYYLEMRSGRFVQHIAVTKI